MSADANFVIWWQLTDMRGVLEVDAPAFELHRVVVGARTVARWLDEWRQLGAAPWALA